MSSRQTHRFTIFSLGALLLIGLNACAMDSDTGEETGALSEGLTVLEAEEGVLSLAFRQGDDVIFMEALRGQPSMYEDEPTMPDYEVDARFLADDGTVFYSSKGGDHWVDPSWGVELDRQTEEKARTDSNEHLFQLADEVGAILEDELAAQLGADRAALLAPEMGGIQVFATNALRLYEESATNRAEYLEHMEQVGEDAPLVDEGDRGDVAYGSKSSPDDQSASFASGYYYIALHAKCIYLCGGDHSSTQVHQWQNEWVHVHDFCNHGECASGMSRKGLLQYYEALQDYKPAWTAQTCGTHYDWDSSGGGHNCHDDSRLQMNNFVFNSSIGGSQYWCGDSKTDLWKRPDANGDDDRGYNHPYYTGRDNGSAASCPSSMQGDGTCDAGCRFPDYTHADPDCRP